jgi:hypothetical protein
MIWRKPLKIIEFKREEYQKLSPEQKQEYISKINITDMKAKTKSMSYSKNDPA